MIDWTKSMKQTYEFYIVNPVTGLNVKKLDTVTSASVSRDITSNMQVSGSIDYDGELDEEYVRIYLVAEQNNEVEKIPLITMLCQTPSTSFNGKRKTTSITGYSPLVEMQDVYPPFGYTIPAYKPGFFISDLIYDICSENVRTKVLEIPHSLDTTNTDPIEKISKETFVNAYVSDPSKSWFELFNDLVGIIGYIARVDELGKIYFEKTQTLSKMKPTYTFDANNSSILSSDLTIDRDLYGIPNVIEIICTLIDGNTISKTVVNDDKNSSTSTVSRGRKVVRREINPDQLGKISKDNQNRIEEYAYSILEKVNTLEYRISYSHGYCGNNVGDCVRINYPSAGIVNEKAYVISQKIDCKTGCMVEETAILTKKLFERKA